MPETQTPVVECTRCGAHYFPSIEHLCADVAALIKKRDWLSRVVDGEAEWSFDGGETWSKDPLG
jgi:hypothetical protein